MTTIKEGDTVLVSSTRNDIEGKVLEVRAETLVVYFARTGQTVEVPTSVVIR